MSKPAPTPEKKAQPGLPQRRELLFLSIVGGAALLLAGIAIIVLLGLRGSGRPSEPTPSPTEITEPTPAASASPMPAPSCETLISSGDVEVSIALPISLTVKDTAFPVEPFVPDSEAWDYPTNRTGTAVWVCGTVVNYLVGLEPTPENETLVNALTPGEEIRLQLTNGAALAFRFAGREEVTAGDGAAMAQQKPRLTLILPRGDTWQTSTADYVAEAEPMELPPSDALAQPGQPVQVGDARVTVTSGHVELAGNLPSGTMYYLVEFSVENVGEAPLAVDRFSMKLKDSMGNTYLLSPPASEAGEFGPLAGEIAPAASAQGSAGYLVPDPLPTGALIWTFSPRAGSGVQAGVGIPYEGQEGGEPSPARADVVVNDAFFSTDGNTLIIEGEVRNTGAAPITIEETDVSLSSSAGPGELTMTAPPVPWTLEPGETRVIELQYQRPDASTVLLDILGYSFEIDGLQ